MNKLGLVKIKITEITGTEIFNKYKFIIVMSRVLRIQSVIHVSIISLKNHNVCICEFLPTELTCYTKHVLLTLYCTLVSSLISMLQITIYYLSVTIPVSYHEAQHDCLVHQRFEQPPCITWMVQLRHSLQ